MGDLVDVCWAKVEYHRVYAYEQFRIGLTPVEQQRGSYLTFRENHHVKLPSMGEVNLSLDVDIILT